MTLRNVFLHASMFILAGALAFGQADPKEKGGAAGAKEAKVTGCLGKGDAAGQYTLTTKSGQKLTVAGTADMEKHVGHTVTLTGARKGRSFDATALEHVAPTCDSGGTPPAKTK
jgi:hypothetical protein